MRIKKILAIMMVAIMLTGCGGVESKPQTSEKKEDKIETVVENVTESEGEDESTEETTEDVATEDAAEGAPEEPVASTETQKTEKKSQKTETKKNETVAPAVTTPTVSAPVTATPEPEVKVETCEHWYQPVETKNCASIKQMVWACNGCGYALFDISSTDYSPINFSNMYVHPPCETERFDEPCCGGGYHSEMYYYWEGCYECHTPVILRSCTTFHVMAERCIQNESNFGPYDKIETGHAYIKSCDCGKNLMVSGEEGGMMLLKEQCCYCGDVKTYPEK